MVKVFDLGGGLVCWLYGGEYYLYGVTVGGDPRVLPSEAMAREIAAAGHAR